MRKRAYIIATIALIASGAAAVGAQNASAAGRQLINGGTTSFAAAPAGDGAAFTSPEFPGEPRDAEGDAKPTTSPQGPKVDGSRVVNAGGDVKASFPGLNFRQQRLANGGNQFSLEPPDQGLCAGNGFVLESVNDVLRVFDSAGNAQTGVVDLNTFYGYAAAINRTTGARGPFVTDPTCYFDPPTQRWFHVVLTLDVDPATGAFLGSNHLDLAVSASPSPLGSWTIYRLPVQDDGSDGTPDHKCSGDVDANGNPVGHGPCIGDYPHIGADAYGIYLTTNEYSLRGPEFKGAQIYGLSKSQLVAGVAPSIVQFDTAGLTSPGFTVWPASAPAGGDDLSRGGTEFLLSGLISAQPGGETPTDRASRVATWALTNTSSLAAPTPTVKLASTTAEVEPYAVPPKANQKAGDFPLGQCLNDTTAFGVGCWAVFFKSQPPAETLSKLDANDGRMQQVTYFRGKLYGALDTAVRVEGAKGDENKAGIEWFVVRPEFDGGRLKAESSGNGYVAVSGNNVTYPAIGVSASGQAVMAFTLVGNDHYPSAAYVQLGDDDHASAVRVLAEGLGPQDGFSGYNAFSRSGTARPRWGDYGATAVVGNTVWMASEYIAQTCTLAQYVTTPIGSCGGTRASLGNWATRVSAVSLGS